MKMPWSHESCPCVIWFTMWKCPIEIRLWRHLCHIDKNHQLQESNPRPPSKEWSVDIDDRGQLHSQALVLYFVQGMDLQVLPLLDHEHGLRREGLVRRRQPDWQWRPAGKGAWQHDGFQPCPEIRVSLQSHQWLQPQPDFVSWDLILPELKPELVLGR